MNVNLEQKLKLIPYFNNQKSLNDNYSVLFERKRSVPLQNPTASRNALKVQA